MRWCAGAGLVFAASPRVRAREWWRRHGLTSFYGLPVMLDGALLAVLTFNARRPFDEGYRAFVELVADQVSTALTNARARSAVATISSMFGGLTSSSSNLTSLWPPDASAEWSRC